MPLDAKEFKARVAGQKTVWAAGAWDALSAKFIEEAGFEAVLTSGFAVSASFLGAPDAELYTMSENLTVVRNVIGAVKVPVVADIDTGYGNAINVMRTVREFEAAGASAVILEDQVAPRRWRCLPTRSRRLATPRPMTRWRQRSRPHPSRRCSAR
jgi:methylisocitrate lyase